MTGFPKKRHLLDQLIARLMAVVKRMKAKRPVIRYPLIFTACWFLLSAHTPPIQAEQPTEYRLKAAFLYNFAVYTKWPALQNQALNLCIYGEDPFGEHLQHLRHKKIHEHEILIRHTNNVADLPDCQIVFITRSMADNLDGIIKQLNGMPILTIADTPGTARQGVVLNMTIKAGKVTFEANIAIAEKNGLKLSSQLLRFASEVYQ